ncbi:MAG TPA: hypothetical protein PK646_02715 [Bacillota bacterium]|jgi:hypothetical protein|nr:hypothetical protein [Fastidiosipila sp.]HPX93325.1 hypothetical protein [Bacillota bacterium]HQB80984.1 hypothetical protein [Bacillota bacterium]
MRRQQSFKPSSLSIAILIMVVLLIVTQTGPQAAAQIPPQPATATVDISYVGCHGFKLSGSVSTLFYFVEKGFRYNYYGNWNDVEVTSASNPFTSWIKQDGSCKQYPVQSYIRYKLNPTDPDSKIITKYSETKYVELLDQPYGCIDDLSPSRNSCQVVTEIKTNGNMIERLWIIVKDTAGSYPEAEFDLLKHFNDDRSLSSTITGLQPGTEYQVNLKYFTVDQLMSGQSGRSAYFTTFKTKASLTPTLVPAPTLTAASTPTPSAAPTPTSAPAPTSSAAPTTVAPAPMSSAASTSTAAPAPTSTNTVIPETTVIPTTEATSIEPSSQESSNSETLKEDTSLTANDINNSDDRDNPRNNNLFVIILLSVVGAALIGIFISLFLKRRKT